MKKLDFQFSFKVRIWRISVKFLRVYNSKANVLNCIFSGCSGRTFPYWISDCHRGGCGASAHYIPRGDNSFGNEVPKKSCQTTSSGKHSLDHQRYWVIRAQTLKKRRRPQQHRHCCHPGKPSDFPFILAKLFFLIFWQFFVLVTDKWLKEVIRGLSTVLWSSSSVRIIIRCHCVVMNKRDLYQGKKP